MGQLCDCKTSSTTHKRLHSLDEPALAFVIIDPDLLLADYHIEAFGDALAEMQGSKADGLATRHTHFPTTVPDSTQCLPQ